MNVLLLTLGSHGDVHPFVGLALALRDRGHKPIVVTNGHFQSLVESVGVDFLPVGTDQEYRTLAKNQDLWSPSKSFKVVFEAIGQTLRKAYEIVADFVQKHAGDCAVVSSSLGLAARIARDKFSFPLATVHLQPAVLRSLSDPPKLPGLFMPRWMPLWMKRAIWNGGDKFVVDPIAGPPVNALRRELGLPPVKRILKDWWNSPDLVVGMFPEWYAPRAGDWPAQFRATGFPLWDEAGVTPISPALEAFLQAGDPPVAFTPGSAMTHGADFFAAAVEACEKLTKRALLLTRNVEQIPAKLPDGVIHVDYAPFTELLPRCAALVHHGGIGSAAQGLRSGVPQLLQPMAHDQPDNARRLERLGVALSLSPRRFTGKRVARVLGTLLGDATYAQRAREIARNFAGSDGLSQTATLLENLVRSRPFARPTPAAA
jgi:rhamnosyltransferase subunit B